MSGKIVINIANYADRVVTQISESKSLSSRYESIYGLIIEQGLTAHLVQTYPDQYALLPNRGNSYDMGDLLYDGYILDIKSLSYAKGLSLPSHKKGFCISNSCERYGPVWYILCAIGQVDLVSNQIYVEYSDPILVTDSFKKTWINKGDFKILPFISTGIM